MRHAILISILLLSACRRGAATDQKPGCDTSTDDGARAAYQRATGKQLPSARDEWTCVDRAYAFPSAVKIGNFAHDLGCAYEGVLYGCTFASATELQRQILVDAGWDKADPAGKQKLVDGYWRSVYGTTILDSADYFPKARQFEPPTFTWGADGSLTFTYWSSRSHGMTQGSHFTRHQDQIAADGGLGASKVLDDYDWNGVD